MLKSIRLVSMKHYLLLSKKKKWSTICIEYYFCHLAKKEYYFCQNSIFSFSNKEATHYLKESITLSNKKASNTCLPLYRYKKMDNFPYIQVSPSKNFIYLFLSFSSLFFSFSLVNTYTTVIIWENYILNPIVYRCNKLNLIISKITN